MNARILQVVVPTTWTQVLPANPDRVFLKISSDTLRTIWWYVGEPPAGVNGLGLPANSPMDTLHADNVGAFIQKPIWAISASVTDTVTIIEGFR